MDASAKCRKYDLVPPDGGWGYMIWITVILNLTATTSFVACFGMIFKDLLVQLDMDSTSVSILGGITAMGVSISGFVTGILLKFMSMRQLGYLAAILLNLGSFFTIFAKSKTFFFICQGILQSLGIGILQNISFSALNDYFSKKRLLSLSFTQTIPACVALFSSQLVKLAANHYGLVGPLLLVSAVNMHTFVAVTLIQPVSWHLKKTEREEIGDNETKLLMVVEKSEPDVHANTPTLKLTDIDYENSIANNKGCEKGTNAILKEEKGKNVKSIFLEAIDISLLRSFVFTNAVLGLAICIFGDLTFVLILPQTLYTMQWTENAVALALSLQSLGDLITRIMFIFLSNWLLKFKSQEIYIVGLIVAFFTRIGMLGSENEIVMLTFLTIMGTSRSVLQVFYPLVIADSVRSDKFTSGMGIFMLIYGFVNLIFGPLVGAVRDLTGSYPTAIYVINSCFAIVVLFWSIEICYRRNKHKRKPKTSVLAAKCENNKEIIL